MPTGKPRKDPTTGYLMNHALPSTDVTKTADANRAELFSSHGSSGGGSEANLKKNYYDTLNTQVF